MSELLKFTGRIVGRLCIEAAERNPMGAFVENLPPLDVGAALDEIASGVGDEGLERVRVAILGGGRKAPKKREGVETTTDEQVANQWRNDEDARAGVRTITLVLGPASKLNSLRTAVRGVGGVKGLREAVSAEAISWLDQPARRHLWEALEERAREIPTANLLEFAASLERHARSSPASLLEIEGASVHRLGLLRSSKLVTSGGLATARKALIANLRQVAALEELSDRDRSRLIDMTEDGDANEQRVAQAALRFSATRERGDLEGLSVEDVRATLKRKAPTKSSAEKSNDSPRPQRVEGDQLAVDLLLGGGKGAKVAAERFVNSIAPDDEGSIEASEVKVGHRTVEPQPREGTAQSTALFASFADEDVWGGLVLADGAQDFVSATKMVVAGDVETVKFSIRDEHGVRGMLAKGVDRSLISPAALRALDEYVEARTKVLRAKPALIDHPLLALAGDPDLQRDVAEMLSSYGAALSAVRDAAQALTDSGSVEPGRRLVARMLSLDLVFVRLGDEWQAVASPMHPFHLWRVNALLEIFSGHTEELNEIGDEALKAVIADPHTSAPHVVLSPYAVNGAEVNRAYTLTSAGSFGALPMFTDPQGRHGGKFRVVALAELSKRLMRLMPHAAIGLRVTLVDPPSVAGTLEKLVSLESVLDDESYVPLHATVLRTRPTPEATDEEDQKLANIAKDLVDAGGSLTVRPDLESLGAVADHLKDHPAHLTAVFDPGTAKVVRLGAVNPPPLSPLTLPRAYHYDAFDDRIDVVISGDVPLFSAYHDLFCRTIDMPSSDLLGRRSGAARSHRDLERVAMNTVWLSVIDQGIEPTFRLSGADRLDWRQDAGRDIVTVTAHPETVEGLIRDATRVAGLPPTEERVKGTVKELFELSGEAILALLRTRPNKSLAEPRFAKGVIGVLAAVRWYLKIHPQSLIVSLDDPVSRRWILGFGPDDRHGDLIAIRSTEAGPVLEAIEVKAHDNPSGAISVGKKAIKGKAVGQVDQTLAILRGVLGGEGSPVASARRDILRDQLYRAVAARQYQAGERSQFVNVLEELFRDGPADTSGLIFSVQIEPEAEPSSPSEPEYHRSPEKNRVGLVELVVAGRRRTPPPPSSGGHDKPGPPALDDEPAPSESAALEEAQVDEGEAASVEAAITKVGERLSFYVGDSPTGTRVVWDPHDPDRPLNNFGLLVTGDSGAGKTQVLRAFIHEVADAGFPVCAFDYKNDYSDKDFSDLVGLTVYDVNRRGLPFNPLELVPDATGKVQPIRQIHEMAGILGRVFGLGVQMEARLRKAMQAAYAERGVKVKKWLSVEDLPAAPSFDDVVETLGEDDKNETLLNRLDPLFDLGLFPASEDAPVSFDELLDQKVALLLAGLPNDQIKQALSEFIIVRIHGHALRGDQPRELRRLLVFDEAWRVADSERLHELAREGRAFGIGIAIGTQFPGDIPDSLAGNLATQLLLLNQSSEHRKSVVRTLLGTTSGREAQGLDNQLQQLQTHQGFLRNQQYAPYILVTTEPHYRRVQG